MGRVEYTESTPASEVIAVVEHLESEGTVYQVNGGWGVDALVGRQTRPHRDVDVFVDSAALDELLGWLEQRGYALEDDYLPVACVMVREDAETGEVHRVDAHPMVLDDEGSGFQSGEKDRFFLHPANRRTTGTIGGRPVVVGDREHLEHLHTGYPPREVDLHDLVQLQQLRQAEQGSGLPPVALPPA